MSIFLTELESSMPSRQSVKLSTEPDLYGLSRLISKSLYMPFTPYSFANFQHGWIHADLEHIEQFGILNNYKYLVATKEQEELFKNNNKLSIAVGAPYIYVAEYDKKKIIRKPNSLLVMPPHGLDRRDMNWDEQSYVKEISLLNDSFDHIVACVHHSCVTKGNWVNEFKKYGISCIIGAQMEDKNALIRMHRLFSSFEYMTTNVIGSHIAYAAYSGCKVSIYGNYAEWKEDDLKDDALFKEYPFLLKKIIKSYSKAFVTKKFPDLFLHPKSAQLKIEWAQKELGKKNKKSYIDIARLLGWLPHQQLYYWSIKFFLKIKKMIGFFYQ